jgi:hypothetical protein
MSSLFLLLFFAILLSSAVGIDSNIVCTGSRQIPDTLNEYYIVEVCRTDNVYRNRSISVNYKAERNVFLWVALYADNGWSYIHDLEIRNQQTYIGNFTTKKYYLNLIYSFASYGAPATVEYEIHLPQNETIRKKSNHGSLILCLIVLFLLKIFFSYFCFFTFPVFFFI